MLWNYYVQSLISFGALLACARSVKATSSDGFLKDAPDFSLDLKKSGSLLPIIVPPGTSTSSSISHWMEARLRWGDDAAEMEHEEEGDLMDFRRATISIVGNRGVNKNNVRRRDDFPFPLRMPFSFEDPFSQLDSSSSTTIWTEESARDAANRLQRHFGIRNNNNLETQKKLLKTGTTIAGVCGYCSETGRPFVVLGADTRATAGRMVADKRCSKVHCLASNIYACGAGTSADLEHITRYCRYSLAMQSRIETESIGNTTPRKYRAATTIEGEETDHEDPNLERRALHSASVAAACRLFRDQLYDGGGSIGANLIVGGVDEDTGRPHIRAVHPHGSMDLLPYAALGSGGLAAMAVIESRYHNGITLEEGIRIVKEAILSGIMNDMGSGSQVDLCVITTTNEADDECVRVVSKHTRAVISEESLPTLKERETPKLSSSQETKEVDSRPGVNGFGFPYSVRSKRIVVDDSPNADEERVKQWNKILGITN